MQIGGIILASNEREEQEEEKTEAIYTQIVRDIQGNHNQIDNTLLASNEREEQEEEKTYSIDLCITAIDDNHNNDHNNFA